MDVVLDLVSFGLDHSWFDLLIYYWKIIREYIIRVVLNPVIIQAKVSWSLT